MAYLDHIDACNRHDPDRFLPFVIETTQVGWVRHDVAARLAAFAGVFRVGAAAVLLHPALDTPEARSQALDEVGASLAGQWGTPALRGERYRIARRFSDPPLATIDRGMVTLFGVRAFGIHVNGLVRRQDGPHLWIGKRAGDKSVAPGKLDNMVAGGQPAGLSLMDNLVKEAAEEADIAPPLAQTARPVGAIAYCMEDEWGLKPDVMFCYDLEMPEGVIPRNTDGEVDSFSLMPAATVAQAVRDTSDFKFNVNLVIIDFLIRHGLVSPDSEPDYAEIVAGLRRGWR